MELTIDILKEHNNTLYQKMIQSCMNVSHELNAEHIIRHFLMLECSTINDLDKLVIELGGIDNVYLLFNYYMYGYTLGLAGNLLEGYY